MKLSEDVNLKQSVNWLEDAIITLSGPALAISGIIAGVDLLTGGHFMQNMAWLTLAWAITLMLTLDFQVLTLGVRAKRIYLSDKKGKRKGVEIVLACLIAAAIAIVSIQMQSIIARSNGVGISVEQATLQLGINPLWLIWERSALVLFLIFLAGWFREEQGERKDEQATNDVNAPMSTPTDEVLNRLVEQVSVLAISVTQITTTVTQITQSEQKALPERAGANGQTEISARTLVESEQGEQDTSIGERIKMALASNTALSDRELATLVGCSPSTANKWKRRIQAE
jgi:hypothetical protein